MEKSRAEKKYESVTNGEMKRKWEELKSKAENKEIKTKEEYQEYKELNELMEKIQKNLPMVENLLETKKELVNLRDAIIEELSEREIIDKENEQIETEKSEIAKELELLMKEEETVIKELKNEKLSDKDKETLQNRLNEIRSKKDLNDKKYLENDAKKPKAYDKTRMLAGMSKEELENKAIYLRAKMGVCEFYMNRLLKGEDLKNIKQEETTKTWNDRTDAYKEEIKEDIKRYTCSKERKEKIDKLKDIIKAERDKKIDVEKDTGEDKKINVEKDTGEDKKLSVEQGAEKKEETKADIVSISEFDQKHPRLAAVKNWFKKIVQKVTTKTEKEEIKEEDLKKIEKGLEENLEEQIKPEEKEESRRETFMKDLKFFEGADMSKIAETGYKEAQKQQQKDSKTSAIEKLIEAKKKAGEGKDGGTIAKLAAMNGEDKGDDR